MFRNAESSIVKGPDPLTADHVPEKLVARQEVVKEIARSLEPALSRRKPVHVWIHGPAGSGKTTVARSPSDRMRKSDSILTAYVSGWRYRTFYSVLDSLTTQLHVLRAEEQRTAARLHRLEKHLGETPCIIILDDLGLVTLREREDMLHSLAGIANVGLICISASEKALLELDRRVRARLNPRVIMLKPYTSDEITQILEERASLALVRGSWHRRTLSSIAKISEGNAALAVEILRAAAYAAEAAGKKTIRPAHIRQAKSRSLTFQEGATFSNLTPHHIDLCKLIRKKKRIPSDRLHKAYLSRCRGRGVRPVAPRTYSKYISGLINSGLIRTVGRDGGSRVFAPSQAFHAFHSQ